MSSDASGTDGYGYFHGYYNASSMDYVSKRWANDKDDICNSHTDELHSLVDFLETIIISNCILVWITDSQSAAYSINKGNCVNEMSFLKIKNILEICDLKHITIVAMWVPREHNLLADYLSHLSTYMNRDTVSGRL